MPGGKPGGLKPGGGPTIPGGAKGIGGRCREGAPTIKTDKYPHVWRYKDKSYLEASCPFHDQQAYHVQDRPATD